MSDEHLRALERRAQQTGSVEDDAAFLRAALRAMPACQPRVAAAAAFGDAASSTALGVAIDAPERERAACACVVSTFRLRVELGRLPREANPAQLRGGVTFWSSALDALERWAGCPCARHARALPSLPPARPPRQEREERVELLAHFEHRVRQAFEGKEAPPSARAAPLLVRSDDVHQGALLERIRAWQLDRPLPDLAPHLERWRARDLITAAPWFAAAFPAAQEVLALDPPGVPSRWGSAAPVAPVLLPRDGYGPAVFGRLCGVDARVVKLSPAELLHERLPRWSRDGLLVATLLPWVEHDPLDLARTIAAALPDEVADELRAHMDWLARKKSGKAANAKAAPGRAKGSKAATKKRR